MHPLSLTFLLVSNNFTTMALIRPLCHIKFSPLCWHPASKGVFTVPILNSIIQAIQVLNWPVVHTALFLIAFHSFLRISNLLPTSASKFNSQEHLSRGSIRFAPPGVHITKTWSKTLQAASSHKVLQLAASPVYALNHLFSNYPQPIQARLFSLPSHHGHIIITKSQGRVCPFPGAPSLRS